MSGWIGYDLDGTLAYWGEGHNTNVEQIGPPIPAMVARLKAELAEGHEIRIVTARVAATGVCGHAGPDDTDAFAQHQRVMIQAWCREHLGVGLEVTASKDFRMWKLYDDRAVQVIPNTGATLTDELTQEVGRREYWRHKANELEGRIANALA